MGRFVALYRGINVGGKNVVKMASLRAMHEGLGHRDVASYIQSGNVVFDAVGTAAAAARAIEGRFTEEFGFSARALVVGAAKWAGIVRENPFAEAVAEEPKLVHAGICDGAPDARGLRALLEKTSGREAFEVQGAVIYLYAPDGVGNSKFAAGLERASGVPVTMRNWRTILALASMADGTEP